ncbi:MAG: hypothetical protein N3D75_00690 [Candidatus Aenigmarchaeota archaeon]|nr:hypothetical protein [Candidatus Aenigmarchaeota archaeon]
MNTFASEFFINSNSIKLSNAVVAETIGAATVMQSPAERSVDLMIYRERPKRVQLTPTAFLVI